MAKVSIVIAARDEAHNIADCLDSILAQDYHKGLLEVIVVDDFSTDKTTEIVRGYPQVKLLCLKDITPSLAEKANKKLAVHTGIVAATGEIIMTIDADCTAFPAWVTLMVSHLTHHRLNYITGPIRLSSCTSWLDHYQGLEILGMNALTAFGIRSKKILLSNAANSCFYKSLYLSVEGFNGIDDIASGDDVLFLNKVYKDNPKQIGYCKSNAAIIHTTPQTTLSAVLRQRIRWASKYGRIGGSHPLWIMGFIFIYTFGLVSSFVGGLFIDYYFFFIFGALFFFKLRADHWYLSNLCREFERPRWMRYFLPSFLMYPVITTWTGLKSILFKRYQWKGRKTY